MTWLAELHHYQRKIEAERRRQRFLRFARELERVAEQMKRNQMIIDALKQANGCDDDAR